jgi:hypothetical protein
MDDSYLEVEIRLPSHYPRRQDNRSAKLARISCSEVLSLLFEINDVGGAQLFLLSNSFNMHDGYFMLFSQKLI